MPTVTLSTLQNMRSDLVNSKYYLNIRSGYMSPVTLHCSQGDTGEEITFYIFDGGDELDLTGSAVSVHGVRKDGANFGPFACTTDGNAVAFNLQSSMTAVSGGGIAELVISKSNATIGTCNFGILVEEAVFPNGVSYDSDPSVYQDILTYVQSLPAAVTADYTRKIGAEVTARTVAMANESSIRAEKDAENVNAINVQKTRIDTYLSSGTAATNSELVDIRVRADGTTAVSAGEAVRSQVNNLTSNSLMTFSPAITDSWLTTNQISSVRGLVKDRIYNINGVTASNLVEMPDTRTTTYNGSLVCFGSNYKDLNNSFGSYLFFNNMGKVWTGIDTGTTIRWVEGGIDTTVRPFYVKVDDTYIDNSGVSNAYNLTKNRVYNINNVTASKLSNMPDTHTDHYNGSLFCMGSLDYTTNQGFNPYIFVNNMGKMWSGIDISSGTIRWKELAEVGSYNTDKYLSLDSALCDLYGSRILILGDSIVYGSHMSDAVQGTRVVVTLSDGTVYKNNLSTLVWTARLISYLSTNYNATVVNNSWPGARFQDLVSYYSQIVTATYDYVFICMGVNNWSAPELVSTSLDTLANNLPDTTKIVLLTPLDSTTYNTQISQVQGEIKSWASSNNMEIADLQSTFNLVNYLSGHTLNDVLEDGIHYTTACQPDIFESAKMALHI